MTLYFKDNRGNLRIIDRDGGFDRAVTDNQVTTKRDIMTTGITVQSAVLSVVK